MVPRGCWQTGHGHVVFTVWTRAVAVVGVGRVAGEVGQRGRRAGQRHPVCLHDLITLEHNCHCSKCSEDGYKVSACSNLTSNGR